jgi:hypothetical protein
MPYDVRYRDQDGRIRNATVHDVEDTGDGFLRIQREYHTVIDPGTDTMYIPKEDVLEIKGPRDATVMETDFHPPITDTIKGAIDAFDRWRHGK